MVFFGVIQPNFPLTIMPRKEKKKPVNVNNVIR